MVNLVLSLYWRRRKENTRNICKYPWYYCIKVWGIKFVEKTSLRKDGHEQTINIRGTTEVDRDQNTKYTGTENLPRTLIL